MSLIWQGRFFVLFQAIVEAFIPRSLGGLNKQIFYKLCSSGFEIPNAEHANGVEIVLGTESSVVEIVRDLYSGDSEALKFYENFYRNGIEAWIARSGGKVVGVVWLYTGKYLANWGGYDAWLLQVEIEPTAKFVANVFVDPLWRSKKIFRTIIAHCVEVYSGNSFYSCVEELNSTSVKAHERIGFRSCAFVYYVRFLQRTYCIFVIKNVKGYWRRWFRLQCGEAAQISILEK
ncbi:MAG: GNAT family N-acetyltransferase [Planctomycetaceae bacterium]|nr:GNAT family N-acetyltransferase [Planctomycetaceae bacterium]